MAIEAETDVVAVRQRARRIAELLGFDRQAQTRIATAVSEIARNAFSYAGGGRAEFLMEGDAAPQALHIRITDNGKGIADLDTVLEGRYKSPSGMGLGLIGARRLMDRFDIESDPATGTRVTLVQHLPGQGTKLSKAALAKLTSTLTREDVTDPLTALREQNRELLQNLNELRLRQEEAQRLGSELVDTNRGVVALYAELDERATQLRLASEQKSRFLSNMSHEFRTPLNSVLALSRLLIDRVDGDLTPEQERQVTYIRRSAESLLDLVNDLLDLAKVEAGKIDIRPSAFRVSDLFGALRGALKPLQANSSVELIFEPPHQIPELLTDEAKTAQILRNLIANALKFTESGEVRVSAAYDAQGGRVTFSVHDTGIGIASENMERIFEEFSQIETHLHKQVKGTGLGLSLSRNLARLLGGDISVESVLGQGSVFRLTLPVDTNSDRAREGETAAERKRVLVIDDDETFQYVIRQIISGHDRYHIFQASNAMDGLRLAREEHPDVILLDLQMPQVDGFAVLKELRSHSETRATPVVISTSLTVNDELRARLPAGMKVMSKGTLSRDTVFSLLRQATQ